MALGLVLAFFAGEILFRVQGDYAPPGAGLRAGRPEWLRVNPPGSLVPYRNEEFEYFSQASSLGLREREIPRQKPPGQFRIVALGDSFTEGMGAPITRTWPRTLERLLGRNFLVVNAGICGDDPFYAFVLLRDRLAALSPDLVILAQNATDVTDAVRRGGLERFAPDGTVVYPHAGLGRRMVFSSAWACFLAEAVLDYHWMYLPRETFWADMVRFTSSRAPDLVERFRALGRERGFSFAVIYHPMHFEVISGRYCQDSVLYLSALKRTGAPVLDLMPFFLKNGAQKDLDRWFWPKDGHLKPWGYEVMAGEIRRELAARGLLGPES